MGKGNPNPGGNLPSDCILCLKYSEFLLHHSAARAKHKGSTTPGTMDSALFGKDHVRVKSGSFPTRSYPEKQVVHLTFLR